MAGEAGGAAAAPPAIHVDADACPVRAEAIRVGARHGLAVNIVSNGGIRPSREPGVRTVIVAEGPDAADRWIAGRIRPGDICVTADIPLAARCVEAGGTVVKPDGETLTAANIGPALATRDLMADLRAAAPLASGGGGRSFTRADRSRFLDALERTVRAALRG